MNDKIFVTKSIMPTFDEYINEIRDIWDSRWLSNMGEKHNLLQSKLQEYLKVQNISLMNNGHLALEMVLQSMELKGEIITTPFTFASTTHAIVRSGLKPVFCDIKTENYTIDAEKIEELITEETSAILPVHVYGNICDVDKIEELAKKYNLKVIYDAAHAFGVTYKERGIGTYGDASMFSFHATKVYHTIEGGAITFADRNLGQVLEHMKNFGLCNEGADYIGGNAKMNEFQAAMGLCNLLHIDDAIRRRKEITLLYRELLNKIRGIKIIEEQKEVMSNYSYFPIVIEEEFGMTRDEMINILHDKNIVARKYFYPITSTFKCYDNIYEKYPTPIALDISKKILTLPLYPELTEQQVLYICETIKEIQLYKR